MNNDNSSICQKAYTTFRVLMSPDVLITIVDASVNSSIYYYNYFITYLIITQIALLQLKNGTADEKNSNINKVFKYFIGETVYSVHRNKINIQAVPQW